MKTRFSFLVGLFCAGISLPPHAQAGNLTLEDVVQGTYTARTADEIYPLPGGTHYARMNPDGTQITRHNFLTGKAEGTLFDISLIVDCPFKTIDGFQLSPDGTKMLLRTDTKKIYRHSKTATYYIYIIGNKTVEPLSDGGPQECPVFSEDGELVAFVRDNNIYLIKLLFGNSESQVTKDGAPGRVLNGKPDWVYEEEFGMDRALAFSPDNQMLCWVRWDETQVGSFSYPLFAGEAPILDQYAEYPGSKTFKYPKAGTQNARVSIQSFDIKSRVIRTLKVPLQETDYVPRIQFTREADKLSIAVLNRNQTVLDLYMANPRSGECKLLLRDQAKYYISEANLNSIRFYEDGFTYLSEKDGYNHLYFYTPAGTLRKQLTQGRTEVQEFYGYQAANGNFYYCATLPDDPLRTGIYATNLKNGKTQLLSPAQGTNTAVFSSDCSAFMLTHSSLQEIPTVALYNNKGKKTADLIDNRELAEKIASVGNKPSRELFRFSTPDGTQLHGWMMKPAGFDPSKRYPVVMYQYSGPKTQEVTDRWNIGFSHTPLGFDAWLTTQGFIVACIDPRGTGGRGADFSGATYQRLGVQEADDQVSAAKYLGTLPYIDGKRIGIWGWSFGGTTATMSILHPSHTFKAAVAVAPVTDWRFYDTAYTERYMRTPQENHDGYEAASALSRAENLQGKFLLIHGLADDNVHYQNTAQLSERLVQAGKQFDMQVYTNRDHGIYGGNTRAHLFARIAQFFKDNL